MTNVDVNCPFCHQSNNCQAKAKAACWCFKQTIPPELIALAPTDKKSISCICANCVDRFLKDPLEFAKTLANK